MVEYKVSSYSFLSATRALCPFTNSFASSLLNSFASAGFSPSEAFLKFASRYSWLIRSQGYERVMIFCNTKHMCQRLCDDFQRAGVDCECLHGDIRQSQREKTMQRYRAGKLPVLVATDVASRGIDVDDVDCVINFDIPEENEYYVHRIGRTGRAKRKGIAWSIIGNFPEKAKLDEIAKFSNYTIQPMVLQEDGTLTPEEVKAPAPIKRRFR